MPWYVLAVFLALSAVALYHAFAALRNLEQRLDNTVSRVFALGIFAGRERFTAEGWRHRRLASVFQVLAFVLGALLWAISGKLFD